MPGKLYLANPSSSEVVYRVNGILVSPDGGADPVDHTPSLWSVNRTASPDERRPSFFMGEGNELVAKFEDVLPHERPVHRFAITIPRPPVASLDDDLILYVFREHVMLMNTRGFMLSWVPEDLGPA